MIFMFIQSRECLVSASLAHSYDCSEAPGLASQTLVDDFDQSSRWATLSAQIALNHTQLSERDQLLQRCTICNSGYHRRRPRKCGGRQKHEAATIEKRAVEASSTSV